MLRPLKPILFNPELASSSYTQINSNYLEKCFGCPLFIPILKDKSYIFSCFALSVDGKLCFPDLTSGFAIAKYNTQASLAERQADWWNLLLARSISDAVIIGSNSLALENFSYQAEINLTELKQLRQGLAKPEYLLHILITRDISKINFTQELICQDPQIPLLIVTPTAPKEVPIQFAVCSRTNLNLTKRKLIMVDPELNINQLITKLHSLGIKTILNESPYYHHKLQELKLLTEAWLNTSGIYIGGSIYNLGQQNTSFAKSNHPHYTFLTIHALAYNFIYSRYKISYANPIS